MDTIDLYITNTEPNFNVGMSKYGIEGETKNFILQIMECHARSTAVHIGGLVITTNIGRPHTIDTSEKNILLCVPNHLVDTSHTFTIQHSVECGLIQNIFKRSSINFSILDTITLAEIDDLAVFYIHLRLKPINN